MMTIEKHTESFYVTGGTLRRDAACYVQRRADQALYDGLMQGKFCYVLTSRQMGKSSLMVRTAARLREEGVHIAVLDLTAIGQNLNAEQWYDGLLARVGQQFQLEDELEDAWLANPRLSPLLRWMKAIETIVLPRLTGRIVIFVDEIDAVRSLPFSTDEFFAAIRELYNRRTEDAELERLTFCLLGVATPSDLIRDTRTTPFNIGQRIELNDFSDDEAEPLARGLGREENTATKLLKRILYWTGGHPYLTQRLCQAVAADAQIIDVGGIDRLCEALFFSTRARETDDNLLFVREQLLRGEADKAALLDLYAQVRAQKRIRDDETNPLVSVLRLSGVTRVVEGLLYVRNRIYYRVFDREWVLANLPDAELLRQKAAYRRGVFRTATIAAVMLTVVSGLAVFAFWQRNQAKQQSDANRKLAYSAQMNLAGRDWDEGNAPRVGELLNAHFPSNGQEDLRGFEWFYLWRLANGNARKLSPDVKLGSAILSADQKQLVIVDEKKNLTIWDTSTWQRQKTFSVSVTGRFAFSPDGRKLVMGELQKNLRLLDLVTAQESQVKEEVSVNSRYLAFSPDSRKLAVGYTNGSIKIWEIETWQESLSIAANRESDMWMQFSFSPDGKLFLACRNLENKVQVWDAITGKEVRSFNISGQTTPYFKFSPDNRSLACSDRSFIVVWDVLTGKELVNIKSEYGAYNEASFSPDGQMMAAINGKIVKVWEARTGRELFALKGLNEAAAGVVFTEAGKKLMAMTKNGTVLTWDIAPTSKPERIATQGAGWGITFSPDGKMFAAMAEDGKVHGWDASSGQELFAFSTFEGKDGGLAAFTTDGKRLVTIGFGYFGNPPEARIWNLETQQLIRSFRPQLKSRGVIQWLSSDGTRLVTQESTDNETTRKVWDVETEQELFSVKDSIPGYYPVAFSRDGRQVAFGMSKTILLCDAQTGKELRAIEKSTDTVELAFSPDGERLAAGSFEGEMELYEVKTGRLLSSVRGHAGQLGSLAFSPDGKRLASGGNDHKIKLWDGSTGQELLQLSGHTNEIWSVAFAPDGKTLLSGGKDNTIRFWRAATDADVQARRGQ